MSWQEILGTIIMLGGTFFAVVAGVGVFRLPDVFCRAHALGKALTLGIMLLLIGYGISVPGSSWPKLLAALIFQFVTIPVSSHLFALTAYRKDVRRWVGPGSREPS